MIHILEEFFRNLAKFQKDHKYMVFGLATLLTIFMIFGVMNIGMQTDLSKEMPQDLPIYQLRDKVADKFGGLDTVLVVFRLDSKSNIKNAPTDIRDPEVINSIVELQNLLEKESLIEEVQSTGTIFEITGVPDSTDEVKQILSQFPGSGQFFSKDYTTTLLYISASLGSNEKKIEEIVEVINENIDSISKPKGVKISLTGNPPIRGFLLTQLQKDALNTILIAALLILIMLIILEKSLTRGLLIFTPLSLGLIWTLGLMGWLNIHLSIATVGIGAMILGLGVEYGVFMVHRYKQERFKGNEQLPALQNTVSQIGSAISGSSTTTMVGFLALLLASMPLLQHLGSTLALGIFFSFLAAIVVSPSLIILEEDFRKWFYKNKPQKFKIKPIERIELNHNKHNVRGFIEKYGNFVAHNPYKILILALIVTFFSVFFASNIELTGMDYMDILPGEVEVVSTMNVVIDMFGGADSVQMVVETNPKYINSNEIRDIRNPAVLKYLELLGDATSKSEDVVSVTSTTSILKQMNDNHIPQSIETSKRLIEQNPSIDPYISKDYSMTLVKIRISDDADEEELEKELSQIIKQTPKPAGVKVGLIGDPLELPVMVRQIQPDMKKTSTYSLIGILVIIFLLFFSIKHGLIPLTTIVFGTVWCFGFMGLIGFNLSSALAGVVSMIMGIGIDFGIQTVSKFREELKSCPPEESMIITYNSVFIPMGITTLAAAIGFRAMGIGKITIMGDLGKVMTFGIIACMIAAITIVPALLIIGEKMFPTKIKGKKICKLIKTKKKRINTNKKGGK